MGKVEVWKDINNYTGIYKISTLGRVKNNKNKILSQCKQNAGYMLVHLYKNKKRRAYTVHRLVALAFLENLKEKPQVNHKDGNKLNNNVENLEWMTAIENNVHANNNNLIKRQRGHKRYNARKIIMKNDNNIIKQFKCIKYACEYLDKPNASGDITRCCQHKRLQAYGYEWEYVN